MQPVLIDILIKVTLCLKDKISNVVSDSCHIYAIKGKEVMINCDRGRSAGDR